MVSRITDERLGYIKNIYKRRRRQSRNMFGRRRYKLGMRGMVINRKRAQRNKEGSIKNKRELNV